MSKKSRSNRFLSLLFAVAFVLSTLLYGVTAASAADLAYQDLLVSTGSDENQLLFTWYTDQAAGKLAIQIMGDGNTFTEIGAVSAAAVSQNGIFVHKAVVDGLLSSTAYEYMLLGENGSTSDVFTITTGNPQSFSFFAVGDPQIGADGGTGAGSGPKISSDVISWKNTLETAVTNFPNAGFLLSAGDQVETSGSGNLPVTARQYAGYLSPKELDSLPMTVAVGNHDSNNELFREHYGLPNMVSVGGQPANVDYWYRYGGALFMVMDSNTRAVSAHINFLNGAIAANPDAKWKIVTFHHSPYSEADHAYDSDQVNADGRRSTWTPVFDELGIDVVLAGHDHSYTRTFQMLGNEPKKNQQWLDENGNIQSDPTGLLYNTVLNPAGTLYIELNSSTGSKYYSWRDALPLFFSAKRHQSYRPEFSVVDMTNDSFTITTYVVDTMEVVDTYTIVKSPMVTFDAGNGVVTVVPVLGGYTVEKPENPARPGYTFAGWFNGDEEFEFGAELTADITLTAIWDVNESDYMLAVDADVCFNRNNGTLLITVIEKWTESGNIRFREFDIELSDEFSAGELQIDKYTIYVKLNKNRTGLADFYIIEQF